MSTMTQKLVRWSTKLLLGALACILCMIPVGLLFKWIADGGYQDSRYEALDKHDVSLMLMDASGAYSDEGGRDAGRD